MADRIPTHRPAALGLARRAYESSADRKQNRRFYNGPTWRAVRAKKLKAQPLCEVCKAAGRIEPATQVHHRLERRQRPDKALSLDNLESVCIPCHNAKRGRQTGGGGVQDETALTEERAATLREFCQNSPADCPE